MPGNNNEAAQDRLIFVLSHKIFSVSVKQPRSQGLSSLPQLVGTETLVAAGHVTIYPSKTTGWVGTQVHLVERTTKYHPGEGEVEQLLVAKHDFSAKTTESSDIPLSPCLSKFVTVTIKNPVAPPFQQIFLPPRF